MYKKFIFLLLLVSCSEVMLEPYDASRADGIIILAAQSKGNFQTIKRDIATEQKRAKMVCQSWSYKDAQALSLQLTKINCFNEGLKQTCTEVIKYQCIDKN
ncbi:MAG: YecR-like lipofamily protein [Deltaproteobacteria bacterium]|jgi:hypothetical protein|nr:YecR-like lipofamily protein [Deltaproteobacteria bacterium]